MKKLLIVLLLIPFSSLADCKPEEKQDCEMEKDICRTWCYKEQTNHYWKCVEAICDKAYKTCLCDCGYGYCKRKK